MEIAELLLKADADANIQAKNGVTVKKLASQDGHNQAAELLVKELVDDDAQKKTA